MLISKKAYQTSIHDHDSRITQSVSAFMLVKHIINIFHLFNLSHYNKIKMFQFISRLSNEV